MGNWKQFFKGKRVTVMGLGLLGRGVGDAIFLAEHGAELIVTDLRAEKTLAPSLAKLKRYKNIRYTLGEHKLEDFRSKDFILKAAGVPLDSAYVAEARKHDIPIEMDASLFAKLMPKGVTLVGVTGTRGKSTTTALIYEILSSVKGQLSKVKGSVYKGGNLVPEATLPLLAKVRAGDIVVLELDSWQLQGFHDAKISPQVAVFTTFLDDHLIYYKGDHTRYFEDKVAIFKYQNDKNILIAGERVAGLIGKSDVPVNGDFVVTKKEDVPTDWTVPLLGEHNLENIACALAVANYFKIPEKIVQKAVENFKAVPGRLEFLREVRGIKIYNDNNATTPDATLAALRALNPKSEIPACQPTCVPPACADTADRRTGRSAGRRNPKQIPNTKSQNTRNIILICGGTDKGLDMSKLADAIPKYCKAVVMLKETGTEKLKRIMDYELRITIEEKDTLKGCVEEAMKIAQKGDIVLYSPAFASFGKWFKNECDRGNQFLELIQKL